jgi:hypothetical protein
VDHSTKCSGKGWATPRLLTMDWSKGSGIRPPFWDMSSWSASMDMKAPGKAAGGRPGERDAGGKPSGGRACDEAGARLVEAREAVGRGARKVPTPVRLSVRLSGSDDGKPPRPGASGRADDDAREDCPEVTTDSPEVTTDSPEVKTDKHRRGPCPTLPTPPD